MFPDGRAGGPVLCGAPTGCVCGAVCRLCLIQHLQKLGVKVPFDKNKADFSRLSPEALFISDVLQSVSD